MPVGLQGTQAFDRFAFVNNNPLRYVDPSGYALESGCEHEGCGSNLEDCDNYPVGDEPPFDDSLGGNNELQTSDDFSEDNPNPSLEILVPANSLLHVATIYTEYWIVKAEIANRIFNTESSLSQQQECFIIL